MNRELLKKINRVINQILKRQGHDEAPNSHLLQELVHIGYDLRTTDDFLEEDWAQVSEARDSLLPQNCAGAAGKDLFWRVERYDGFVKRSLSAPMPISATRFPQVADDELRDILDRDLEEAESAQKSGNLKSCMVLCGSILEAALYDYLSRDPGWTMKQTGVPKHDDGTFKQIKSKKVEDQWTLEQLVNFSCTHGVIADQLRGVLHGALREPRNLVHPVAELRKGHRVDPETADLCMAALNQALKRISEAKGPPP